MSVRFQMTATLCVAAATALGWWLAGAWLKPVASAAPPIAEAPRPPAPASPAASRRQQWIHTITSAATPSAQLAAALAIAREVDPADFPELLKIVRALPGDTLGAFLQRAVLRRWLEHDPAAALASAETQDRQLLSETLGEWARMEPAEAVAWFRNAPRRLVHYFNFISLAKGVAARDPEMALEVVKSLPRSWGTDPFDRGQVDLIALFETMAHGHPEWLLEQANGLPKELARPARFAAAGIMAQQDSAGFLQWALAQPDRNELLNQGLMSPKIPCDRAIAAMAGLSQEDQARLAKSGDPFSREESQWRQWLDWTPSNPWAALRQLDATSSLVPELREQLVDAVATSDAFQNDPARAVAELTRIAPERRSEWADWFVEEWALKDTEAARAWVATVPEAEGRADLLEKIDDILRPADPASSPSAQEILVSRIAGASGLAQDVTAEQRREVLEASARTPAENDGEGKVEGLEAAADRIMERFPAEAAPWLATQPQDEATTVNQASGVAARWAREEPVAAAEWSARLPAGRARTWALWNAAAEFHRLDPSGARAWAEALPDPSLRTVATQAFAGQRPEP
jgi:hypothetical protein